MKYRAKVTGPSGERSVEVEVQLDPTGVAHRRMGSPQWGQVGLLAFMDFAPRTRQAIYPGPRRPSRVDAANAIYCTRSITGRFMTAHAPVFGSHLQLTKQRQLPCSIFGLSART